MYIAVHGWRLQNDVACLYCDNPATVAVHYVGTYDEFNLCATCLDRYNVAVDQVEEIFRKAGL